MKLLIQTDLVDTDLAGADYTKEVIDFLKTFSIWCKEVDGKLVIPAQKVTLDEWHMNELFNEYLMYLPGVSLKYAPLGGAGCDFTLELTQTLEN